MGKGIDQTHPSDSSFGSVQCPIEVHRYHYDPLDYEQSRFARFSTVVTAARVSATKDEVRHFLLAPRGLLSTCESLAAVCPDKVLARDSM